MKVSRTKCRRENAQSQKSVNGKASNEWQSRFHMGMQISATQGNLPAGEMRRRANEEGNEQRPPEKVGRAALKRGGKSKPTRIKRERKRKNEEI